MNRTALVAMPNGFTIDDLHSIALEAEKNFCDEQEKIWGNCIGFISAYIVRNILMVIEKRGEQ